jgi:plastocyanin
MRLRLGVAIMVMTMSAIVAVTAYAATTTVTVKDDRFAPKSLTISKGTTVRWVWRGSSPHNVTVKSGPAKFASPTQKKGAYSKRLARAGTYRLYCTIHGTKQSMTITVR